MPPTPNKHAQLDEKRQELCQKLARDVIKIIAKHVDNLDPFEQDQIKLAEMYKPVFEEFLELFLSNDVPMQYVQFLFSVVSSVMTRSASYISLWANTNQEIADAITFNRESAYDVTFKDLAEYLDKNKEQWFKRIQDSKNAMGASETSPSEVPKEESKPEGESPSPYAGQ